MNEVTLVAKQMILISSWLLQHEEGSTDLKHQEIVKKGTTKLQQNLATLEFQHRPSLKP